MRNKLQIKNSRGFLVSYLFFNLVLLKFIPGIVGNLAYDAQGEFH